MKAKSLLSQIYRLEDSLSEFSIDELNASEAFKLKESYASFKKNIEAKIFNPGVPAYSELEETPVTFEENVVQESAVNTHKEANKLIANVSHEIRTPLNGIIGFADLLKETKLQGSQIEQVNAIQSASYSLMEIINELLEYSKLSAGLETFESIDFNLNNLVKDVSYLCDTLIVNKEILLKIKVDEAIPETLIGDPSKLSQILLNIMGNAIKFVEKGQISLEVALKELRNKKTYLLEFTITDTGIGMSSKQLNHIFDSFKQAEHDTFTKYGGTGLGLTIVKQIIEKLEGDIKVKSKKGVGTTFNFTIPYKEGNDSKVINKNKNTIDLEKARKLVNGARILIFEDNILNQKLIEQRLKSWDCKTHITDAFEVGMALLENNPIDLVLMDLKMPGMNGFEISEKIRAHNNTSINQVPIIALSADFSVKDEQLCKECGINDTILKPYSPNELLIKLVKNKNMKTIIHPPGTFITVEKNLETKKDIDLNPIWEECMEQIELFEELIRLFKQNAIEFIGVVKIHLANGSYEEIGFAAHKIKAGLAMLKTESLYEIIVQIQNACKKEVDIKHMEFLYHSFLQEYPKVEKTINKELKKFKKA